MGNPFQDFQVTSNLLLGKKKQRQSLISSGICNSLNNSISELYLDFANQDFTNDLIRFFKTYPGSNLKVLYDYNLKYRVIF